MSHGMAILIIIRLLLRSHKHNTYTNPHLKLSHPYTISVQWLQTVRNPLMLVPDLLFNMDGINLVLFVSI